MLKIYFLIIIFFSHCAYTMHDGLVNKDKSLIIFFGLLFLVKSASYVNCVNNFYLKIKRHPLYKRLYAVNSDKGSYMSFLLMIINLLCKGAFFTDQTFSFVQLILLIKFFNLIFVDRLNDLQSSIKNDENKKILLIFLCLLPVVLGKCFIWIFLLDDFISFSEHRNFIYLFIIYITIEKAIYCAFCWNEINFEDFISRHKNVQISFTFNQDKLLNKIKEDYGQEIYDDVYNYFQRYKESGEAVMLNKIDYKFINFLKICDSERNKLIINFNHTHDYSVFNLSEEQMRELTKDKKQQLKEGVKLKDYFVAKMELSGLLFACLGHSYLLYSIASFDTLMRNHAYCINRNMDSNAHGTCKNGNYSSIMKDFNQWNANYPVELIGKLLKINVENDFSANESGFIDLNKIKDNKGNLLKLGNIKREFFNGEEINHPEGIISCKIEKIIKKEKMNFKKICLKTLPLLRFLV